MWLVRTLRCLILVTAAGCAGASSTSPSSTSPSSTSPSSVTAPAESAGVAPAPVEETGPRVAEDEVWPERWASRRWEAPLARAREAYAAGRFVEAAAHYLEADREIGSSPRYRDDLGCWGDRERTLWAPLREGPGWQAPGARQTGDPPTGPCEDEAIPGAAARVRSSFQCEWGLAALAGLRSARSSEPAAEEPAEPDQEGAEGSGDDEAAQEREDQWGDAIVRSGQCDAGGRAVSALLRDRPYEAALHAAADPLPPPFAHLVIPETPRRWAEAIRRGETPSVPTLEAAEAAVAAHAALALGVTAACQPAEGAAMTYSEATLMAEDAPEEGPVPPFSVLPSLAFISCRYDARGDDLYSWHDGFGNGSNVGLVYLLERSAEGVHIGGAFAGHEWFDCANGNISEDVTQRIHTLPGGAHVYERLSTHGAADQNWEDSRDVVVLCHLETARCRELTVRVTRIEDGRALERTSASVTLLQSRLRARSHEVALPAGLRELARPVDALTHLAAGAGRASGLAVTAPSTVAAAAPATPAARAVCTVRIADSDGQTNVRPAPSTAGPPLGTLATGTVVTPAESRGRWMRISAPLAGWVWSGNLARRCE